MSIFEESVSYRPFKYPKLVEMTKKHQVDMHWTEAQVELQDDLRQYNASDGLQLPNSSHEVNKSIIDKIMCLFTEMDKIVAKGYTDLLPLVKNNEVRNWFLAASSREVIHQRAYALAAETFGFEDGDWVAFKEYKEMQDKLEEMQPNIDPRNKLELAMALTTLLLSEGICLFGAFAVLLNYKRYGLLMGVNDINQWSLEDENEHVVGNIYVLKKVMEELDENQVNTLIFFIKSRVERLVEAEHAFIDLVYELGEPEGLTKQDLKGYISYLGELRLFQLGLIPEMEVSKNPLPWIESMLSGRSHDNFFEKRVTDYSHSGLEGKVDYERYITVLDK